MDFKEGDIIKGLFHNSYGITNEDMKKAIVLSTWKSSYSDKYKMKIRVIEHTDRDFIDETYDVDNDKEKFEKIKERILIMKKDELKNGYILTLRNGEKLVVGDDDDELINITPLNKDDDGNYDFNRCYDFDDFKEDLTNYDTYERDVIKVEKINSSNIVVSLFENATLPTLSISEIEEKFKVKVKNEDKPRFYIGDKVRWKDDNRFYYIFKAKDSDGDYYIARDKEEFEEHDGYYVPEKDLILVNEDEED